MRTNTITVQSHGTAPGAPTLGDAIETAVSQLLTDKDGILDRYELSGTVLEPGLFGRSLVTIYWEENPEKPKKGKK